MIFYEGKVKKERKKEEIMKKSPVPGGNPTADVSITRRVFYRCLEVSGQCHSDSGSRFSSQVEHLQTVKQTPDGYNENVSLVKTLPKLYWTRAKKIVS